jgi:hypothetical protein
MDSPSIEKYSDTANDCMCFVPVRNETLELKETVASFRPRSVKRESRFQKKQSMVVAFCTYGRNLRSGMKCGWIPAIK